MCIATTVKGTAFLLVSFFINSFSIFDFIKGISQPLNSQLVIRNSDKLMDWPDRVKSKICKLPLQFPPQQNHIWSLNVSLLAITPYSTPQNIVFNSYSLLSRGIHFFHITLHLASLISYLNIPLNFKWKLTHLLYKIYNSQSCPLGK